MHEWLTKWLTYFCSGNGVKPATSPAHSCRHGSGRLSRDSYEKYCSDLNLCFTICQPRNLWQIASPLCLYLDFLICNVGMKIVHHPHRVGFFLMISCGDGIFSYFTILFLHSHVAARPLSTPTCRDSDKGLVRVCPTPLLA